SEGKSIILLRMKRNENMPEPFHINFPLPRESLTILVSKVSFRSGENLTDIQDRQYIGATLEKCIFMKDGKKSLIIRKLFLKRKKNRYNLPANGKSWSRHGDKVFAYQ